MTLSLDSASCLFFASVTRLEGPFLGECMGHTVSCITLAELQNILPKTMRMQEAHSSNTLLIAFGYIKHTGRKWWEKYNLSYDMYLLLEELGT